MMDCIRSNRAYGFSVKERVWCFQFRRSLVVKGGRWMSTFLLVSDHAGHNVLGPGPLSHASAGQWILGGRIGLYWDWSNVPGWIEANLTGICGVKTGRLGVNMKGLKNRDCCSLKNSWAKTCGHICCWSFPVWCCFPFQGWRWKGRRQWQSEYSGT
jgi:hypothetical protein